MSFVLTTDIMVLAAEFITLLCVLAPIGLHFYLKYRYKQTSRGEKFSA
jgi:hypothetical protein